jgi:hypothetical protein
MSSVISTMTAYDKYYWDTNTLQKILYDTNKSTKSINAIRSCIEADEATLLLEAIGNNYNAKIYCLICCFTFLPSVKCIELLISEGTPLDKSFEFNPFQCTAQEYLDKHFGFTVNKLHTKARNSIYQAIEKGKRNNKNKEHIIINMNIPVPEIKTSTLKRVGKILISPLTRNK